MLLDGGHHRRGLPLELVAALSALAPARRFRLPNKGRVEVGCDADFALVRLDESFTLTDLHDRWQQNPYRGETFRGRVVATYLRGRKVYEDGVFDGSVRGKLLKPDS